MSSVTETTTFSSVASVIEGRCICIDLEDDLAFEEWTLLEEDMSLDMDCDDGAFDDMVQRENRSCQKIV